MARAGSGSTGTIWAAVVFGIGFTVCLVLAIVFYTRIEAAEQAAGKAMAQLDRFAKANERTGNDVILQMAQDPSKSVVGHLLADNARLKQIITGSTETNVAAIDQDMQSLKISEGQTLMREIRRLRAEEASAKELENELTKKYEAANRRASAAETAKNRVESSYRSSVKQLKNQLAKLNKDYKAYQNKAERNIRTLASQLKSVREQSKQKDLDHANILTRSKSQISLLKQRIARLESRQGAKASHGAKIDPSTLIDGKIASVLPEENTVYINLGRKNRLLPGITFEVYDPKIGVVKNALNTYRGKATIQVTNVFENTAIARIVRTSRKQTVFAGDLIANLVYDPDIRFKFYVYGEFDLDHVGKTSQTDRRRIQNMIAQWGGKLVTDDKANGKSGVSYDVDFLVMGQEPILPPTPDENEVDPTIIEQHARAMKRFDAYQALIKQAQDLSIPILNQNRFLAMVGYYHR